MGHAYSQETGIERRGGLRTVRDNHSLWEAEFVDGNYDRAVEGETQAKTKRKSTTKILTDVNYRGTDHAFDNDLVILGCMSYQLDLAIV